MTTITLEINNREDKRMLSAILVSAGCRVWEDSVSESKDYESYPVLCFEIPNNKVKIRPENGEL